MFLYRFLNYQTSTKAYDKNFQVEISEEDESYFINLFNSPDLHYWYYLIRSKIFLDYQDMIEWQYILTPKLFNDRAKPYLIVCHKDENSVMNPDVMPRYFKNTRKEKIQPNLFELETLDHLTERLGRSPYSKFNLFRNCLMSIPPNSDPQTQSLKSHLRLVPSGTLLDFRPSRKRDISALKTA